MANQPKKYTKFVAAAATATLVASAIVPVASAAGFSDVADTNSHAVNINALAEAGIIGGYPDGTFKPNQELTRGQVVKMLGKWVEAQGFEIPADYATKARFTDLAADAKDQELVKYAALVFDTGVFAGSNGALNAGGKITRENMALVLDRAFKAINDTTLVEVAAEIEDITVADLNTAKSEAREAIQALRNLGISGVENFMPKDSVTRAQFATFLNKTINTDAVVELTVKEAVAVDANTVEVTLSDDTKHTVKLEKALEANKATEIKFTIGEKEYTAEVTYEVKELLVEGVKAITSKSLEVTFNRAAAVTAESFTVTKGSVKANIAKVEIAEDGKTAKIELTSKLTEGEYTVAVAQEGKDALTGKVTVQNEKLSAIEILSEDAIVTAGTLGDATLNDKASTTVKIANQYGEDITKLNTGVTITVAGAGTAGTLKTTGELELAIKDTAKIGDLVIVTIVDTATGVSTSKSLKLSDKAVASEVAFGELYNKDGKTLSQDTDLSKDKFYLPVTVKDQYGKEIVDPAKATNIVVTNANDTVAKFSALKTVKIDNKDVLVAEVTEINFAGTTNVIAVSITSGKSAQASVTVAPGVKVNSLTVSAPAELVTANKDVYFPLTIVDTKGNEVKSKTELSKIKDTVTPSTGSIVDKNAKGEAGLFVKVPAASVVEATPLTVVVTSTSGKVSTQTVVAKAEAVPTVITGLSSKVPSSLRSSDTDGITITNKQLVVEDQYGQVITDETVLGSIKFDVVQDPASVFTLTPADNKSNVKIVVPAALTAGKSTALSFKLTNGTTPSEASTFTKTFTIVEDSQFVSYEVADLEKIYAETDETGVSKVKTGYGKDFVVKAKTATGEVVTLTKGTDYSVTGLIAEGENVTFAKDAKEATIPATITINANGQQFVKQVTYSNVKPVTNDFIFTSTTTSTDTPVELAAAKALEGIVEIDGTTAVAITDIAKIVATDSYNKKEVKSASTVTIVPTDASKVVIVDNGKATANVKLATSVTEATVTLKVTVGTVTKDIQVKLVTPTTSSL